MCTAVAWHRGVLNVPPFLSSINVIPTALWGVAHTETEKLPNTSEMQDFCYQCVLWSILSSAAWLGWLGYVVVVGVVVVAVVVRRLC